MGKRWWWLRHALRVGFPGFELKLLSGQGREAQLVFLASTRSRTTSQRTSLGSLNRENGCDFTCNLFRNTVVGSSPLRHEAARPSSWTSFRPCLRPSCSEHALEPWFARGNPHSSGPGPRIAIMHGMSVTKIALGLKTYVWEPWPRPRVWSLTSWVHSGSNFSTVKGIYPTTRVRQLGKSPRTLGQMPYMSRPAEGLDSRGGDT
ncbi:hypothetical protein BDY21DRAFT_10765 [Lineolata rhizophorae]|uniref:Uncharacterized protein n=1 Tax=Lineolata rhizophorae TaxID=578093 RepID=A0A6A6PEM4_9PEZI|nr:hypothetical protein BDY21DRAFT_10765 [Lineolata rhizophorae]